MRTTTRLTTEKTIRGRWSREDLALYALLAGGAVVFGIVVWAIVQAYEPPIDEGKVIARDFTPAHEEDYMQAHYRSVPYTTTQCTGGYGSTPQTCRTVTEYRTETYYLPATRWVPDDYDVKLEKCTTDDKGKEKCRTGWKDVHADIYAGCKVGSLYKKETESCLPQ